MWLFIAILPQILDFHLKQLSVYLLGQGAGGAQRILTLVKHWLMFFTSICRKLPRTGRGVGPGGSFALSELCLQSERRSRQQRLSTRTTTASMAILLPDTAVLSQHGAFITLQGESTCPSLEHHSLVTQIIFNLSSRLCPSDRNKNKMFITLSPLYRVSS